MKKWLRKAEIWVILGGTITASLRVISRFIWRWSLSRFMVEVRIDDYSLKQSVTKYAYEKSAKSIRSYRADTAYSKKNERWHPKLYGSEPYVSFPFEGHRIIMSNKTEPGTSTSPSKESIMLYAPSSDSQLLQRFLDTAYEQYMHADTQAINMFVNNPEGVWVRLDTIVPRHINSVILPPGEMQSIIADILEFRSTQNWYTDFGIPYKRGYLLFGPPGTGKSSSIQAIAGHFKLDVYCLRLADPMMSDNILEKLMRDLPGKCIASIEDVDAAFDGRASQVGIGVNTKGPAMSLTGGLTFSGVLNVLDGLNSTDGRLLFITTNHLNKLDAALIRPGRVDYRLEFKPATKEQIIKLLERFYPELLIGQLEEMAVAMLSQKNVSVAQIQQFIQHFKRDAEAAYLARTSFAEYVN